jgi:hypothetical protein
MGPGRSTRWARVLEFQDQRPIFSPQDDSPFLVKWNRNGPNLCIFRKMIAIAVDSHIGQTANEQAERLAAGRAWNARAEGT